MHINVNTYIKYACKFLHALFTCSKKYCTSSCRENVVKQATATNTQQEKNLKKRKKSSMLTPGVRHSVTADPPEPITCSGKIVTVTNTRILTSYM